MVCCEYRAQHSLLHREKPRAFPSHFSQVIKILLIPFLQHLVATHSPKARTGGRRVSSVLPKLVSDLQVFLADTNHINYF